MARTYGPDEMERIRKYAYEKGNNYSRQELEDIIQNYTQLNEQLQPHKAVSRLA